MKGVILLLLSAITLATNSAVADGICPNCGITSNFNNMPFYGSTGFYSTPSFFPGYFPWWGGYGAMTYPNFYSPGAWMPGGMNAGFYPGGGDGFMGKPNIYISGPAGTNIKIKVNLSSDSHWLLAVPVHGQSGWTGTLEANHSIRTTDNETYHFFFYDFRFNEKHLQSSEGFCSDRDGLIEKLVNILSNMNFKPNEILDFKNYWSVKLPFSENFCVFPQESKFLDRIATLEIVPKAKSVLRIGFVIIPDEARKLDKSKNGFFAIPKKEWTIPSNSNAGINTQSTSPIEIREWGVGFLSAPR